MISLSPKYWKRYKDIALLLVKHEQRELVQTLGLNRVFDSESELSKSEQRSEAVEVVADLERLGPTFVKLGQLLSTRTDMLPAEYLSALSRLQDQVEPMPFEVVAEIITRELSGSVDSVFQSFETSPIASASIGQVHKAQLWSGESVAVKVQRPGVREEIFTDLAVLEQLAELLDSNTDLGHRYRFTRMLASLRRSLVQEVDYRQEAENAARFSKNLAEFERIYIPKPYLELSTDKVLTMEFIQGEKLTKLDPVRIANIPAEEIARDLFRCYLHQVMLDGFFHADPHPGNLFLLPDHRLALLDFGMVVNVPENIQNGLLKLMMALNEGNGRDVATAAIEMGRPEKGFDPDAYREKISHLVADHSLAPISRVPTGHIVLELQSIAGESNLLLPTELTMLGKVFMHLDESMRILAPAFVPREEIRQYTTEVFRRRSASMMTLERALKTAFETGELAQALPYRVNRITELLAENKLKVEVNAIDENKLLAGMEKIANRVASGLVMASLIVGASVVLTVDSPLLRTVAIIFFVLAGLGGLHLTYRSLRKDIS